VLSASVGYAGETLSEGGFKPGKVSAASLLDVQEATDNKGTKYYKYEILTRTGMSVAILRNLSILVIPSTMDHSCMSAVQGLV
jgi:hypothetical protein